MRDTSGPPTGHEWVLDEDGRVDIFAFEAGDHHNGPHCTRCDEGFCHHCEPDIYKAECPEVLAQPTLAEARP